MEDKTKQTDKSENNTPAASREGEDYYLEKGLYVFTAKHHLKRGYCCQSGCRHCPFGFKKNAL
jgi:Family of unknown function (DUF5522)